MPEPIVIRTFRDQLEGGYRLTCWCPGCKRSAACNLAELVMRGLGDREPQACRPRWRKCGSLGRWTLHVEVGADPKRPKAKVLRLERQRSRD